MTDERIEEIYSVCDAALNAGQKSFAVHVFPFRMTEEKLKAHSEHRWLPFWQELVGGYRSFEKTKKVPKIRVQDGKYFLEKRD